ncbi:TRAP transporter substrate-binding protein [Lentibacillus salinarum]|uniref:TRAP transporter substrate-binding protein n=1 Tax=Lentibacillus salinarum TaxID=446820 RepID=A0ABW3ZSK2_9BACI
MRLGFKVPSIILIFCIVFVGCSNESTTNESNANENQDTNSEEPVVLKFNNTSTSQPHRDFGELFASLIEEKTEGRIEVETYFGDAIAEYGIQPVLTGTVDFNQIIPSNAADLSPKLSLFDAPYIYNDLEHALKAVDPRSPIVEEVNKEIEDEGLRFITAYPMGFRHITSNKEIKSVDDLNGLKIRVVPSEIYQDTISAFGAAPTPMPFSEVATSLTTGVIDGQENPLSAVVPNGIHEMQDYIIETEHLMSLAGIFMNNEKYEQLSSEDQDALLDAATEGTNQLANDIKEQENQWRNEAEEAGVNIIGEDNGLQLEEFKEKGDEVNEQYKDSWGELYNQIIEMGD